MVKNKRVFQVGEEVCFSVFVKGVPDPVWHIGKIVALLPKKKPEDEQLVSIVPYEIPDNMAEERKPNDWETDAPPYPKLPREIIIFGHLSTRTPWMPKKLPAVTVDARDMCGATHYQFLKFFSSGKGSQQRFFSPWHR
ncbi:MAG: hypothetical protein WA082_01590 [Candidatus Moraniibacteriota bacterium]